MNQMEGNNEFKEVGGDSEGKTYDSLDELWENELSQPDAWYKKADQYWSSVDATVDGMLGGFSHISGEDIRGSNELLKELFTLKMGKTRALDCGAGIGRITKDLLLPSFESVDLLEQNVGFVEKAKEELGDKVKHFYAQGLQDFNFLDGKYDLIWVQWVSGHLSDEDFITFFQLCQENLLENGFIVLKENNSRQGFYLDKQDSSVVRSDKHIRHLIEKAGLKMVKIKLQTKFPKELFPVRMYAIQ